MVSRTAGKSSGLASKGALARRVGARILAIRTNKNLSQHELARRSGLDRKVFVRVELAQVSATLGTIEAIAYGLGMDARELIK